MSIINTASKLNLVRIIITFCLLVPNLSWGEEVCSYSVKPSNFVDSQKTRFLYRLEITDGSDTYAKISIQNYDGTFGKSGRLSVKKDNVKINSSEQENISNPTKRYTLYTATDTEKTIYFPIFTQKTDFTVKITNQYDMDGSGYIIESIDWNITTSCTTSGNSIPEIKITSPTTNSTYTSSQPSIKISGTASDQKGVSHIGWYIDSNNSGFAKSIGSGFSTWEANISKLKKGTNKVVITARNTAGKEKSDVLTITYAQPDLIITETKLKNIKSSYEVGDKVTVSATVQNQGKATADASTIRYYLSTGPRVDTNDTYLGSDSIPSLVANKSLRQSEYIYLPSNLGNATYYIGACVDVVTSESSDSNNCTQGSGIAIKVKSSPIQKTLSIVAPSNGVIKDDTGKINCPSSCSANYDVNSTIKLTATPNLNYVFTGFSGCTTNGNQCSFTLDNNKNISAAFTLSNPTNKLTANVSREGSASGTVNSDPVGISQCNWQQGICAANFSSKTVKLIASPDADSIAVFHQTQCSQIVGNTCTVDLSSNKNIEVSFQEKQAQVGDFELVFDPFPQRNIYNQNEDISLKLRVKSSNTSLAISHVDMDWTGTGGKYTVACKADQGNTVNVGILLDCTTKDIKNNRDLPLGVHTLTATAYDTNNKLSNRLIFRFKVIKTGDKIPSYIGTQAPEHMQKFWVIDPNTNKEGFYVDTARGTQVLQLNFLHQTGIVGLDYSLQYNSGFSKHTTKKLLGKGWNHKHGMLASLDTSRSDKLVLAWSSNRKIIYIKHGNEYRSQTSIDEGLLSGYYDKIIKDTDDTYLLTKKNNSKYRFSAAGQLTFIKNKYQQTLALSYINGKLNEIYEINYAKQRTGIYLKYRYDYEGQIDTVTDSSGRVVKHYYQVDGCLAAITDPEGRNHKFHYRSGSCLMTGYEREKAERSVHLFKNVLYGNLDEVISQEDGKGNKTTFTYDQTSYPGWIETTITTPEKIVTKDTYNTNYQLLQHFVRSTNTKAYLTQYSYTPSGMLRRKRDHGLSNEYSLNSKGGRVTEYEYDQYGNTTKIIFPDKNTISQTYDDNNNLKKKISETGVVTAYRYNSNNKITQLDARYGESELARTLYEYNRDAQVTLIKSPRYNNTKDINATKISYEKGRVVSSTNAAGNITAYFYDSAGNIIRTQIKNSNGIVLKESGINYDKLGRTIETSNYFDSKKISVKSSYSLCGAIDSITDAKGQITTQYYDENCNIYRISAPLNKTTNFFYDKDNRKIATQDAEGHKSTKQYNVLGQVIALQNAQGKTIIRQQYDNFGNLALVREKSDGFGNSSFITKRTEYDNRNRIISVSDAYHKTDYKRSNSGRIISINEEEGSNISRNTQFSYYSDNKIKSVTSPVTASTTVTASQKFDAEGNLTQLNDPNKNITDFKFDGNDKEKQQVPAVGKPSNKQYNALLLLDWIKNGRNQKESYTYYENGWLKSITLHSNNKIWTYRYDNNGNILTISGNDGIIERRYDALNRVIYYKDTLKQEITYSYYKNSQLKTISYDGHTVTYTYDKNSLLQSVAWDNIEIINYRYTRQGRLKQENRANGTVREYFYNKDRLVKVTDKKGNSNIINITFKYNKVGDITQENMTPKPAPDALLIPKVSMTYGKDNRLATFNQKTVQFDTDGNMIYGPLGQEFANFTYDQRNRLIKAGNTEYTYTIENHRTKVTQDNKATQYLTNPHAKLSQVLIKKEANGTKTYYIYGLGLVAQIENNKNHYYHYDLRGSTVALSDYRGNISDRFGYMPYGKIIFSYKNIKTPFQFNGRYGVIDDKNGINYMRSRFYNGEIRRFLNRDILSGNTYKLMTLNRFVFGNSNMVSTIDPLGFEGGGVGDFFVGLGVGFFNGSTWLMEKTNKVNPIYWTSVMLHGNEDSYHNSIKLGYDTASHIKDSFNPEDSFSYQAGKFLAPDPSIIIGGGIFLKISKNLSLKKLGTEFSHWIPSRTLKSLEKSNYLNSSIKKSFDRSIYNGNYVTPLRHSRHDIYRNLKGQKKSDTWPIYLSQIDRIPKIYWAIAALMSARSYIVDSFKESANLYKYEK